LLGIVRSARLGDLVGVSMSRSLRACLVLNGWSRADGCGAEATGMLTDRGCFCAAADGVSGTGAVSDLMRGSSSGGRAPDGVRSPDLVPGCLANEPSLGPNTAAVRDRLRYFFGGCRRRNGRVGHDWLSLLRVTFGLSPTVIVDMVPSEYQSDRHIFYRCDAGASPDATRGYR